MPDFLIELLSEEIPARMQARARADLARLLAEQLAAAGLQAERIETFATPRRLALIARGLPLGTPATQEELKGPRTSAPPQALEGFLRKAGLAWDQLEERGGTWFARIDRPGRATTDVIAEAIPAIVRAFPWPKSMRWGAASLSTESLRWVRPLQNIVAMLDEALVDVEIAGVRSSAATVGHRFHHPGPITLAGASDYVEKLRACHVIVDPDERARLIRDGAAKLARDAGLALVPDGGLVEENAGLTEWPIPLLGRFDEAFLNVPREVIQLTMRTNQKYFALTQSSPSSAGGGGPPPKAVVEGPAAQPAEAPSASLRAPPPLASGERSPSPSKLGEDLAPAFVCVANIAAADGGARIVEGNQKVLAARLADARFFWEQDMKILLDTQREKLSQIIFHEKLGTLADKAERVARLARWLVEGGIVKSSPERGGGPSRSDGGGGPPLDAAPVESGAPSTTGLTASGPPPRSGEDLADLATRAARLCKADLVTQMVGEFPELQGLIGGYLAAAQGEHPAVAAAIRDHYKPVGQGDEVPTDPVTVAVSLADKLDTVISFFAVYERPTGSRDPFALRRATLGVIELILQNSLRGDISRFVGAAYAALTDQLVKTNTVVDWDVEEWNYHRRVTVKNLRQFTGRIAILNEPVGWFLEGEDRIENETAHVASLCRFVVDSFSETMEAFGNFVFDRVEERQRRLGLRHDLIRSLMPKTFRDAELIDVFGFEVPVPRRRLYSWGGEDDLVRLLARVRALQAFVETPEGADLLAGYKRAANILRKEGWGATPDPARPELVEGRQGNVEAGPGPVDERPSTSLRTGGEEGGEGHKPLSYTPEPAEKALIAALDSAEPQAAAAVGREDFEGAMRALASLRAPVDAFFNEVTVNDPDETRRAARLDLLARMRDAVHRVADFSRIEG